MTVLHDLARLHYLREQSIAGWMRYQDLHGLPVSIGRRLPRFGGNAHQRRVARRAWMRGDTRR